MRMFWCLRSWDQAHRPDIVSAALRQDGFCALVCPMLLAEVDDVLRRPRIRRRLSAERADAYINDLEILLERVDDPVEITAVLRAPDDDYLVAIARDHAADRIVTGDKDLLEWADQQDRPRHDHGTTPCPRSRPPSTTQPHTNPKRPQSDVRPSNSCTLLEQRAHD